MIFTPTQVDEARRRIPLAELIGRDVALKRAANEYRGLCPFHNEKTPSFYVTEKGFYHCFGCGAHGDAIAFVMRVRNLTFVETIQELLGMPERARQARPVVASPRGDENRNLDYARQIWSATQPITDRTAAGIYLWSRGILIDNLSTDLRAHPALDTREPGGGRLPALVAAVRASSGDLCAIQRIWVLPRLETVAGEGPKDTRAPLEARKKTLGHLWDGCVRLGDFDPENPILGLAEGVETGLSRAHLAPVWVTCGLERWGCPEHLDKRGERVKERPPSIWLPPATRMLILYADNGDIAHQRADYAAWWWHRQGLECWPEYPPDSYGDWNDVIGQERSVVKQENVY